MSRLLNAASILLVLAVVLSGCGAQATPTQAPAATEAPVATQAPVVTQAPAPTQTTQAAAPRCIKIGHTEPITQATNLDPTNVTSGAGAVLQYMTYDQLMYKDSNFVLYPELAESWEANAAGTEWTFHLKHGVKFSDGKAFTAKDAVWTYQRLIDPANNSEAAPGLSFLKKDGIIAVDDFTLKFVTDKPIAELPLRLTTKNTYIVEEGATSDTLKLHGVGTGPFVPVDFEKLQNPQVLVRNQNYWQAGLPKPDCVEIYWMPEATTRSNALLAGQIDIDDFADPTSVTAYKIAGNIDVMASPPATPVLLSMWVDTPPYKDVRVRQALKMVLDREAIAKVAFGGFAAVGDDNPIPPTSPFAWRSQVPARDVEGAKKLLADAGYDANHPLKIDLYVTEVNPGYTTMAEIFQANAAEAGVSVRLLVYPAAEFWDNIWLKQPFLTSGWLGRHPSDAFPIAYSCGTPYPETHWCNKDFDNMMEQAASTIDAAARTKIYQKMGQMLTEQGGGMVPVFTEVVAAVRSGCTGYKPNIWGTIIDVSQVTCQ